MIELSGFDFLVPTIVAAVVVLIRQFSEKLDGPTAYWFAIVVNVAARVSAELVGEGGAGIGAAVVMGVGGGSMVSAGIATAGKRIGLGKIIKPRGENGL